jgi:hypothetical protein
MASAELRAFLAEIAADPVRLGAFMRDPDAELAASDLNEEDKVALRSGDPAALRARLDDPNFFYLQRLLFVQLFIFLPPQSQAPNANASDAMPPADHREDGT